MLEYAPIYLGSSLIITFVMFIMINKIKFVSQTKKSFIWVLINLTFWCSTCVVEIVYPEIVHGRLYIFEYLKYFFSRMTVIDILLTSLNFEKKYNYFNKKYLLFFLLPVISILFVYTNNIPNIFYKDFSITINNTAYDVFYIIDRLYLYALVLIATGNLCFQAARKYDVFSKQFFIILIGSILTIFANISWMFIDMTAVTASYIMPSTYVVASMFYAFILFNFKFLEISSIALKRIVDTMSDGYIILNKENNIIDYNKTVIKFLKIGSTYIKGMRIETFAKDILDMSDADIGELLKAIEKIGFSTQTLQFQKRIKRIDKHIRIELTSMFNKDGYLGTLLLLKDITQHIEDINKIKENQTILMEKERLAVLGQLIGGISHNLKTPIMSISGACEGITDLITEYKKSVEDSNVTVEDHHEIAKEMGEWVVKIKSYTEYMSDVITTVKGQAVALSEQQNENFTVRELIKRVDILMKHELKNALIELKINIKISDLVNISGNINSLIQIINNIISNAIQSYNGKQNEVINLVVDRVNQKRLVISIEDYGCGIPEKVQKSLLKEMVTTKGKDGTGLGMFMSYSNIKAHFGGDMEFKSKEGVGTTFYIYIPI